MGFYAPAQIVRDAREHGVEVRGVCVNASRWDCTLEPTRGEPAEGTAFAVRLGMRMVAGLTNDAGARIVAGRADVPYGSVEELWRRAGVPAAALERLAEADAYGGLEGGLGLDRRHALWAIRGLADEALPLFAAADRGRRPEPELVEPAVALVAMTEGSEVIEDYRSVGLSLRRHPVAFLRGELGRRGVMSCAGLADARDGARVVVGGVVLVRQRPGSARGVLFITIEDETGIANLVVWSSVFERERRLILGARMLTCRGRVQREGIVIHVVADRLEDLSDLLGSIGEHGEARAGGLRLVARDFR
jgi:error-prone DNA polymerase